MINDYKEMINDCKETQNHYKEKNQNQNEHKEKSGDLLNVWPQGPIVSYCVCLCFASR